MIICMNELKRGGGGGVGFLPCSAFVMFESQVKGHQSLVHLLPSADIAEHIASYTWALQGLCLQSGGK